MSVDNGYLDIDQSLINFTIRELDMDFAELLEDDPSRLLRNWLKSYRNSRNTAIATAALGAGAGLIGIATGGIPLAVLGLICTAGGGALGFYHHKGAQSCELEGEILDEIRPVLELSRLLEERGASKSELVSLYDRLLRRVMAGGAHFAEPDQLLQFFKLELSKHSTLSGFLGATTGFSAAVTNPPAAAPTESLALPPAPSGGVPTLIQDEDVWADAPVFSWEVNPTAVPIKERAIAVLELLDRQGFPIGVICNTPTVLGYGGSQSGKSSALHLSAIIDLAMGKKVYYANPDDDIPPIRFTRVTEGSADSILEFLEKLTAMISKASKDQLQGSVAWIDELLKLCKSDRKSSSNDKSPRVQALFDQLLGKGDKTGLCFRSAAQVNTLDALGLSGISEAVGRDFLLLNALKKPATSFERETALGIYETARGGTKEKWNTPDCLKTVKRPNGSPDPVLSMLRWFPELRDESRVKKWLNPKDSVSTSDDPLGLDLFDDSSNEQAIESVLATKNVSSSNEVGKGEVNAAMPAIIAYLRDKNDGRTIDDIYRSHAVRNALGGGSKQVTQDAIALLTSQSFLKTDGAGKYWLSDFLTNTNSAD